MFETRIGYELPAQIGRPGMSSREPRKSVLFWVLAACALMCGCPEACKEGGTTWTAEARSPDGLWLATARSQQWGGPGTAYDATTVYLKWVRGSQPPIQILGFSHQICDDESQDGVGNSNALGCDVRAERKTRGPSESQLPGHQVRQHRDLRARPFWRDGKHFTLAEALYP